MSYLRDSGNKYAVIQPEMRIVNPDEADFSRGISGAHQMVLFSERVASVITGRGPAYGKMRFNLPKYLSDIIYQEVIPPETDSHDTQEAVWGGSRLVASSEMLLTEDAPSTYFTGKVVAQRWVRGDLKNIINTHPVMKALKALLKGDLRGAVLSSLGRESDEVLSTILYNLLGPIAMDVWLGLGLFGSQLNLPVLTTFSLGLFWGIMGSLIGVPNIVLPVFEKATGKEYQDVGYLELLGRGALQALTSTSIFLMNLIYMPVATAQVIWNRIRGKPEEWIPFGTVKRMFERKMLLMDAYRNLWLAPAVGGALALTAGLTGNTAFLTWGSPIWFGSLILGPFTAWYTGTKGKAWEFVERVFKATSGIEDVNEVYGGGE
jgi:hypothetical protein